MRSKCLLIENVIKKIRMKVKIDKHNLKYD